MSFNKYIIDCGALRYNATKIKDEIGEDVKLCGVIKADAYGHGSVTIANKIKDVCDFFAVACIKEAIELRDRNILNSIIVLGIVPLSDIKYCVFNNISINISSITQLNSVIKKLKELNLPNDVKLKIHLKINSGLNRLGFSKINDFKKALKIIDENDEILLEGIFTHFATKDNDEKFIDEQYKTFKKYVNLVKDRCIIIHNCNSFATMHKKEYRNSMVRCGFDLYGWEKGFKPVLSITSEIIQINYVEDATVGYDRTYHAHNQKIAVIPIGYADGFDRRLSNNFKVLVNGEFANVVGNICMDLCMIDVTNIKKVDIGTKVTILGIDGSNKISIYDYAKVLNTSPYEILLKFKNTRMDIIEK